MNQITLDELKTKEVISVKQCRRLGYITDACIDLECGKIVSFTVRDCSGFFPVKGVETCVPWESINKIGDDIILVNACCPAPEKEQKKSFLK